MKTIILCGGRGTRMKEETEFKPKPMVEIGGRPMLWHIMKIYSHYGFSRFVLALGYKGNMVKEYFLNHRAFSNDFTLHHARNEIDFHNTGNFDDFKITFADTGLETITGERLLQTKKYITEDEFMVTYGDAVGDIDIQDLVRFHRNQGTLATLTAVHPYSKYGIITIDRSSRRATGFQQKPMVNDYVNGGFMVFSKKAFDYFDAGPMENAFPRLIQDNELSVYEHTGFWKSMDTYTEMEDLNRLWGEGRPWAVWEA